METKPGWKTTEFWVGLIVPTVVTALNSIFGWGIDAEALLGMFGAGGLYSVGRGVAKNGVKPEGDE